MFVMLGAGALANDILDTYPDAPCAGYFIEPDFDSPGEINGAPVYRDLVSLPTDQYFLGVGDKALRSRMIQLARDAGLQPYAPLVSGARYVSTLASIANGVGLGFDSIVDRRVEIGENCLLMHGAMVSHDATLGNNVVLAPGAVIEGGATIGDDVFIGANAVVSPNLKIGRGSHVSPGTAVFRDVPLDSTVIGNPGRVTKSIAPKIN